MISLPLNELSIEESNALKEKLTSKVQDFQSDDTHDVVFFRETADRLIVPRFSVNRAQLERGVLPTEACPKMHADLQFTGNLRPDQIEAVSQIGSAFEQDFGGTLVAPPGIGKTMMAIALAFALKMKTIVLLFQDDWMTQWQARIQKVISGNLKIGWIQSNTCEYENCDVVLVSVASLALRNNYPKQALTCGVLVVDEVHHVACKTYIESISKIAARYTLGLTATPKKNKELDALIQLMIGPVCFRMTRPPNPKVQVHMITYNLGNQKELRFDNGSKNWSYMITSLTKDNIRNRLLIHLIRLLHKRFPTRKGLLLSARVDHVKRLYQDLDSSMSVVITREIHTDMTKKERASRKRQREEVSFDKFLTLSTYQMMGEARDFDGDFVILATPQPNAEQSTGRVTRERNLEHQPLIFDIVDPFSSFDDWRRNRRQYYERCGYQILTLKERQIFVEGLNIQ